MPPLKTKTKKNLNPPRIQRVAESTCSLCFLRKPRETGVKLVYELKFDSTGLWFEQCFFYGCETWSVERLHENKLKMFEHVCLRSTLRVNMSDHISTWINDEYVVSRCIAIAIKELRLKWLGHVLQRPTNYLPRSSGRAPQLMEETPRRTAEKLVELG